MFAITRGPSRKPACAATKSSAPSLTSAATTNHVPDVHAAERPAAGDPLEEHGVHRLARRRGRACHEQVASRMPARRDRERGRHQHHRALRRLHARLAHDADAVRDRLDARVRAAAQRVGAHEAAAARRRSRARDSVCATLAVHLARHAPGRSRGVAADRHQRAAIACVTRNTAKIGAMRRDRLLDPAQVHHRQQARCPTHARPRSSYADASAAAGS